MPAPKAKPLSKSSPKRVKRAIAGEIVEPPRTPAKTGPKGPTKLTQDRVDKLRQAFAIDATVEEACFYAGINKTTYYNWQKAQPELFNEIEALRHTPVLTARQTIVNALKNDPDMALKYLERKRKAEFSTKVENEVNFKQLPKPIIDIGLEPPKEGEDENQ